MSGKDDFTLETNEVASTSSDSSEAMEFDTPLTRSQRTFELELSELLALHPGKWVAYGDGKRLRMGNSQVELYRHCLSELGLTHDRFIVRRIEPESSPQIEYTLR